MITQKKTNIEGCTRIWTSSYLSSWPYSSKWCTW